MHRHRITIAPDHAAFAGHFPGRPLLPGVALLAEVLEAALDVPELAARLGPAPRVNVAKFLAPVVPGTGLEIHFDIRGARLHFTVHAVSGQATPVASGQFEIGQPS
jgi:3-hydroxyacyl-[acyl-carrier-protein] dehydratase